MLERQKLAYIPPYRSLQKILLRAIPGSIRWPNLARWSSNGCAITTSLMNSRRAGSAWAALDRFDLFILGIVNNGRDVTQGCLGCPGCFGPIRGPSLLYKRFTEKHVFFRKMPNGNDRRQIDRKKLSLQSILPIVIMSRALAANRLNETEKSA